MKTKLTHDIAGLFGAALLAGNAVAAPATAPEPKKTEPLPLLSFADGQVVFDVQEKMRLEGRDNNFDFNSDAPRTRPSTRIRASRALNACAVSLGRGKVAARLAGSLA